MQEQSGFFFFLSLFFSDIWKFNKIKATLASYVLNLTQILIIYHIDMPKCQTDEEFAEAGLYFSSKDNVGSQGERTVPAIKTN